MSETATPEPKAPMLNIPQMVQYGMAAALAASVLALALLGKVPVDTYINLIVIPGLAGLGVHAVAKNLN